MKSTFDTDDEDVAPRADKESESVILEGRSEKAVLNVIFRISVMEKELLCELQDFGPMDEDPEAPEAQMAFRRLAKLGLVRLRRQSWCATASGHAVFFVRRKGK